ncbi:MAG: hypothetical protein AB1797_05340 [bacterium]
MLDPRCSILDARSSSIQHRASSIERGLSVITILLYPKFVKAYFIYLDNLTSV